MKPMLSPRSFRAELHVLKEGGDEQNQGVKQWDNNKLGLELPVVVVVVVTAAT